LFGWVINRRRLLADAKLLGRWGEKRCEKFLKRKGLRTLTRNYSCKTGEIDLIMVDTDRTIVFVEVKSRAGESFTNVEDVLTYPKKTRMTKAARYFLSTQKIDDRPYRFDFLACILHPSGPPEIRHYPNAFTP
jgi:putative endonuclease